jgi:chemotaxis protein CheX
MSSVRESHSANGTHESWLPLLEVATREVFERMLGCQLRDPAEAESNLDVTAMVGLAGQLCGVLSVRCESCAAALMASKMLCVELHKVGPEMADALGEICNMVAGNLEAIS